MGRVFLLLSLFLLFSCSTSIRSLNRYPSKWQGKQVTIKGRVLYWVPADDFWKLVVIVDERGKNYISYWGKLPYLQYAQKIRVTGVFFKDSTFVFLGSNLIVDTSGYYLTFTRDGRITNRSKGNIIKLPLRTRFELPPNCPQPIDSSLIRIQNNF